MDEPSPTLLAALERLRLATAGQVHSLLPHVRRLAGDLPLFEGVWIDALVQARLLTPFQAAELSAGRAEQLQIGPYVLLRPLVDSGFAECFHARRIDSAAQARLYLVRSPRVPPHEAAKQLAALAERAGRLSTDHVLPLEASGLDGPRLWAASAFSAAPAADRLMVESGRFPPAAVLHIARVMVTALGQLEQHSVVHGDISAASLLIDDGRVLLSHPGLRAAVRPAEGYAHDDLFPAAYDYLAPERIAEGTPPTLAGDIYACGALWWHLLTGRPPFAGGNSLAKLQSVHAARSSDVRRLAPDVAEPLAEAIEQCLQRDPAARPASFDALIAKLGPPGRTGQRQLARTMNQRRRLPLLLGAQLARDPATLKLVRRGAAAAVVCCLVVAACWPAWRRGDLLPRMLPDRSQRAAKLAHKNDPANVAVTAAQSPANPASPAPRDAEFAATDEQAAKGETPDTNETANLASARQQTARPERPVAYWAAEQAPALVLPADHAIQLERLSLRPGQIVRGAPGTRPRVVVPARGLLVATEDIRFEGIDFIAPAADGDDPAPRGGLVVVAAARAEFDHCSFRSVDAVASRPGLVWRGPARSRSLNGGGRGQLVVRHCVARHLASAIEVTHRESVSIELAQTLFVDCGSAVRLLGGGTHERAGDLAFDHVTVRDTGPVVLVDCQQHGAAAGRLSISAVESVFALRAGEPLVVFCGESQTDRRAASVEWEGQGSLIAGASDVAAWRGPDADTQPLPDEQIVVAGLVRSDVQFAGNALGPSDDSRARHWQVPLQSAEPPGIGAGLPR